MSMTVPMNNDMGPMTAGIEIEGQPVHPDEPAAEDRTSRLPAPKTSACSASRCWRDVPSQPSDAAEAPPVVIVNDRMARRYWPHEAPMGHRVAAGGGQENMGDDTRRIERRPSICAGYGACRDDLLST